LNVFALEDFASFAVLQSRCHETWARFTGTTMKDDLTYTIEDCFRTFPFPVNLQTKVELEMAGHAYQMFRAQLMINHEEGLTKTYNRFHSYGEHAPDIVQLRALHSEMDAVVLHAYGWNDFADRAVPEFIEQDTDEGKAPKTRLDWPAEVKDEVLARLLALNSERSEAERAAGLAVAPVDNEEDLSHEGESN
jgi:hypothetical protein